jgi:fucose permease
MTHQEHMFTEQTAARAAAWQPRVVFILLFSYFMLFGIMIGGQGVLWAELLAMLRLSKGVFGTVQLVWPLLAVGVLLNGGQLVRWAGKKPLSIVGLALLAGTNLALAAANGLAGLIGALLLGGIGNALLETTANSATLDWEQATGRSVMNLMHAGFSGGAVLGAFAAGLLLEAGWHYEAVLLLIAGICGLTLLYTLPVRFPPAEPNGPHDAGPLATVRLLFGASALLALGMLCVLGIVGESAANLWSVIYLHDLGADAFVGGAAFALFNSAMFVGRLGNSWLVERAGARVSLLVSGALVVLAAALLLLPGGVASAIVAFVLLGAGVAGVVPTVLSAAAKRVPGQTAMVTSAIMAIAYTGFIICPPLTGWIADLFSLKAALVVVGLSGFGIIWLARGVERPN